MRLNQRRSQKVPEVNLIPMLNVMMGILAFFVMITMTLSVQQNIDVPLPGNPQNAPLIPPDELPDTMLIRLTPQGQLQLNDEPTTLGQLDPLIRAYLVEDPENVVVLIPDRQLPYADVVQLVSDLQAIGGDRISLSIDDTEN